MLPIFKSFVAVVDAARGADAGVSFHRAQCCPPRILLPAGLRREIEELKALIQHRRPPTLEIAAPVLASIYFHWTEELATLTKSALAPLASQGIEIHPTTVKSQAVFVAEFCARDFPVSEPATPKTVKMLCGILDNALDGKLNLLEARQSQQPPHSLLTERWQVRVLTRRRFKCVLRDLVKAFRIGRPFGGPAGAALDGRGGGVVDAAAPPGSGSPPVTAPMSGCQCEICNLEISNPS